MKLFVTKKSIEQMKREFLDEVSKTHQEQINRIKEEHNKNLQALVVQNNSSTSISDNENILSGLSPLIDKLKEMTNQSDTIRKLTEHNIKLQEELSQLKKKYDLLKENREITNIENIPKKPLSKSEGLIFEEIINNNFLTYDELLNKMKKTDKTITKNKLISIVNRIKNKGYPWIFNKNPRDLPEEQKTFTFK